MFALIVDGVDGLVDRDAARAALTAELVGAAVVPLSVSPDPATWGMSPDAQAGMAAMDALISGGRP